ncbi:MAG: hypothetical protein M3457_14050 [Chloroflexota bacterium]|nr:hypothetical protein [Chloroflexota bacterium]
METIPPLDDLIAHYLANHLAYGRSPKTIAHYQDTFKLFDRFLIAQGITPDRLALSVRTFRQFATCFEPLPCNAVAMANTSDPNTACMG